MQDRHQSMPKAVPHISVAICGLLQTCLRFCEPYFVNARTDRPQPCESRSLSGAHARLLWTDRAHSLWERLGPIGRSCSWPKRGACVFPSSTFGER